MCCELLSNHYLCANKNSRFRRRFGLEYVVNCFQIIIFVLTRTALRPHTNGDTSCELLSNHYLCANKNSGLLQNMNGKNVVNCFQIIIFVLTRTASQLSILAALSCELLSNHYLCANKNSLHV